MLLGISLFNLIHNRNPIRINIEYVLTKKIYMGWIEIHGRFIRACTSEMFAVIVSLTSIYEAQYSGVYSNVVSSKPLICAVKYFLPIKSPAVFIAVAISPKRLTLP